MVIYSVCICVHGHTGWGVSNSVSNCRYQ